MTIEGGCFCGAVRYEINGALKNARCCHCSKCRKIFSGPSSAYAEVPDGAFSWQQGEDALAIFSTHPEWGLCFCSKCGSTLAGLYQGRAHGVTLGSVDGDPNVDISMHIFVGSKAPWDHVGGPAPQFEEGPKT